MFAARRIASRRIATPLQHRRTVERDTKQIGTQHGDEVWIEMDETNREYSMTKDRKTWLRVGKHTEVYTGRKG
jgi:hypothetical protein